MEIKHARIDNTEVTIQLLRLSCPNCKESVRFAIQDDDRLCREDANYYEERCHQLSSEVYRLNSTIDDLLRRK